MRKIPVILDCDPGADDSLGIILALSSDCLNVLGITTICGNGPVEQMAKNATKICGFMQKNIRVFVGAQQPMKRTLKFTTKYCGADGLCETGLKEYPELISDRTAHEFLEETLCNAEEPVTIIATAGLTNLAEVLADNPRVRNGIREIVIAGGYFGMNPVPNRAEWNILVDAEAADIVFHSGVPIRTVGLDVTSLLQNGYVESILEEETGRIRDFMQACTAYNKKVGLSIYSLLVDSMAIASVIRPEICEYVRGNAFVHPEYSDARLMSFEENKNGLVLAAAEFDFDAYLKMIRGLMA